MAVHATRPKALLVAALFMACLSTAVSAHCKKRKATNVLPGEESFNHKPLLQLPVTSLPKEFNWNEVDGHSLLVPSWNQHIVSPLPRRGSPGHMCWRPQYARRRSPGARPPAAAPILWQLLAARLPVHDPGPPEDSEEGCGARRDARPPGAPELRCVPQVSERARVVRLRRARLRHLPPARVLTLGSTCHRRYGDGCNGGDVIDVMRYVKKFGLPDESCMPYSATDHRKYGKKAEKCPASGYCTNCMPIKVRERSGESRAVGAGPIAPLEPGCRRPAPPRSCPLPRTWTRAGRCGRRRGTIWSRTASWTRRGRRR